MQTRSSKFKAHETADVRPLAHKLFIAFDKTFLADMNFFTVGSSSIGGDDMISGNNNVLQEWDKYRYVEYSDRVLSAQWTKEQAFPYSVTLGMLDFVLDNHDSFFSPGSNSPIAPNIRPQRPVRFFAGFGDEVLPQLVGFTDGMPEIDSKARTATFHCVDFLSSLMDRPMDDAVMYENFSVPDILSELFQLFGLSPTQLDLDPGGMIVNFFFADKGEKLGDHVNKLVEADLGRLFMTEEGVITYRNRANYNNTPVFAFDDLSNIRDMTRVKETDIINVVDGQVKNLETQRSNKYWELQTPVYVPPGTSVPIFADFQDPVSSVETPVYVTAAGDSSVNSIYTTNTAADGSGSTNNTDISVASTYLFAKSYKIVFANSGLSGVYITSIALSATPAVEVQGQYVREQDDASVAEFEEQPYTIDNPLIQDGDTMTSLILRILMLNSSFGQIQEVDVKGTMALQIDDTISTSLTEGEYSSVRPIGLLISLTKDNSSIFYNQGNYFITKIVNGIDQGMFSQVLTVKPRIALTLFTIGVSAIGGDDVIGP